MKISGKVETIWYEIADKQLGEIQPRMRVNQLEKPKITQDSLREQLIHSAKKHTEIFRILVFHGKLSVYGLLKSPLLGYDEKACLNSNASNTLLHGNASHKLMASCHLMTIDQALCDWQ